MKPDADMMRNVMGRSAEAVEAVAHYHRVTSYQFGIDASQATAYRNARDLADKLYVLSQKINQAVHDTDERLTTKEQTE